MHHRERENSVIRYSCRTSASTRRSVNSLRESTRDSCRDVLDVFSLRWSEESDHADEDWHATRKLVDKLVSSDKFDGAIIFVVFVNLLFTVHEADLRAKGQIPTWHQFVAWIFLTVFAVEVAARLYAQRLTFFRRPLNVMDFFVVIVDILCQVLVEKMGDVPSASVLRVLRVARIVHIIRASEQFRELWLMLHGLASAMKAIFWGLITIAIILIIMSVVAVELFRPIQEQLQSTGTFDHCVQKGCEKAFSTVFDALGNLFIMVFVGDLWVDVVMPITKHSPWAGIILVLATITINVGLMNLILAVIVDRAEQARTEDAEQRMLDKRRTRERATYELTQICKELDIDKSGELTKPEVKHAFRSNELFQHVMNQMDVVEDDLDVVFSILDQDRSGTVSYEEFATNLYNMKAQDTHTLLAFLKHYALEIREKVTIQLGLLKDEILSGFETQENQLHDDVIAEYQKLFRELIGKETPKASRSNTLTPNPSRSNTLNSHHSRSGKEMRSDQEGFLAKIGLKLETTEEDLEEENGSGSEGGTLLVKQSRKKMRMDTTPAEPQDLDLDGDLGSFMVYHVV